MKKFKEIILSSYNKLWFICALITLMASGIIAFKYHQQIWDILWNFKEPTTPTTPQTPPTPPATPDLVVDPENIPENTDSFYHRHKTAIYIVAGVAVVVVVGGITYLAYIYFTGTPPDGSLTPTPSASPSPSPSNPSPSNFGAIVDAKNPADLWSATKELRASAAPKYTSYNPKIIDVNFESTSTSTSDSSSINLTDEVQKEIENMVDNTSNQWLAKKAHQLAIQLKLKEFSESIMEMENYVETTREMGLEAVDPKIIEEIALMRFQINQLEAQLDESETFMT